MLIKWFHLPFLTTLLQVTHGLYGYDCGDHLSNLTTISLMEVGDCELRKPAVNITRIYGQLLQINDYSSTHIHKCAIKLNRIISHCGMHSHASRVRGGEISYYKTITQKECKVLQTTGTLIIGKTRIDGIKRNSTTIAPVTLAGTTTNEGKCEGERYTDEYGSWDDVFVAGSVEVELQDYTTSIHLNTNRIILKTGVRCTFSELECIDHDGAQVFWETIPEDFCGIKGYSVLYEGNLNKINDEEEGRLMYSVEAGERTFALWKKSESTRCGYTFISTEHPKLVILEEMNKNQLIERTPIDTANLDMFAYINSKFLYIENHIKGQFREMYYKILKQECEIEKKVLKNAISIATISPDEFGYRLMESKGYLGVIAGEVVHLVKCIRVEVKIRNTTKCYGQLPVRRGEEDLFLAPRTRILVRAGTEVSCDSRIPAMFKLENRWYKMLPMPIIAEKPETLKPQTKPTWKYISPETLAISGIYGEKDLSKLRDMILFPIEKPTVLNNIAQGMTGRGGSQEGIGIMNLFDESAMQELVQNTWDKMWSSFLTFGTASAGIIGILMLCRLIKLLIDTTIHGYAIYSIYGFSIHLIGAIWNSVTQLLLHLGRKQENETRGGIDKKAIENNEYVEPLNKPDNSPRDIYPAVPAYSNIKADSF